MDAPNLLNPERRMLLTMQREPARASWNLEQLLEACQWRDQAVAVGAGHGLQNHGFVDVVEHHSREIRLDEEGERAVKNGLLEQRLWTWISGQETATMQGLQEAFERHEAGPGVGLLKQLGVSLEGGVLRAADPKSVSDTIAQREAFLQSLPSDPSTLDAGLLAHFASRKQLIQTVEKTDRSWSITDAGKAVPEEALAEQLVITDLTPELLQGDDWKTAEFRAFDVSLESTTPRTGRSHPMQALIERIRAIFLEMGFSELVDDYVQSAGWNMDALFIPQDHPAREMQDTFYLDQPASIPLDKEVMEAWKAIHEHGGATGSTGWGGAYSTDVSQRPLLRTHTTVNTVQYLARHPTKPVESFRLTVCFARKPSIAPICPSFTKSRASSWKKVRTCRCWSPP